MRTRTRATSQNEIENHLTNLWKRRMMTEKGYPEKKAEQIAQRLKSLVAYLKSDYALIAYFKQDGTFQLVRGTLIPYAKEFRHSFDITKVHSTFVYWDIETESWRTFQIENFLDWKTFI